MLCMVRGSVANSAMACEYLDALEYAAAEIDEESWSGVQTAKVCRMMALWARFKGFGRLFYLLWGFSFR